MRERLLAMVRERVRNGEITERRLARILGISQPHIHNVLKGVRLLSTELADELLAQMQITPGDLLSSLAAGDEFPFRQVSVLSGKLGVEMTGFHPHKTAGFTYMPADPVAEARRPLAIRLGNDPQAAPRFEAGDLVLIDCDQTARTRIDRTVTYVVATEGGPRLRYVRQGEKKVYLPGEQSLHHPCRWESVPLPEDGYSEIVLGRVIWVSRYTEAGNPAAWR